MSNEYNMKTEDMIAKLKDMEKIFKESEKYSDMTSSKNLIDGEVLASYGLKGPEMGEVLSILKKKYFNDEIDTKEELMTYFLEKILPDYIKVNRKDLEEAFPGIDKQIVGGFKREAVKAIQNKAIKNTKKDIIDYISNLI